MVKFIIIIIFTHLVFVCMGQENYLDNKMELNASFSCDSVYIEDSLEVILQYRNISNEYINLYPKAIIGLSHNHNFFITYDKAERIAYILNLYTNYDSIVNLKPGEEFKYTFNIVADSQFFYEGENVVYVYYRLFDKPKNIKKQKRTKRGPVLSLQSPAIKIMVTRKE